MAPAIVLLLAFAIGLVTGLRSLTAPAVVAWAASLGWLNLHGMPLSFMATKVTVAIFTLLAVLELVADKLPSAPSRTAPVGLSARFILGALSGAAIVLAGGQTLVLGALLGAFGGVLGAFGGYQARTRLVKLLNVRDLVVALAEDALAIGAAFFIASRF